MTEPEQKPPQPYLKGFTGTPIITANTPTEETLTFLEGNIPFSKDKEGKVMRGNVPPDVLEKNWDLLNYQLALGNFDQQDREVIFLHGVNSQLSRIAATPKKKFGLNKLKEFEQVELTSFIQTTKSKESDRDRRLIQTAISQQQTTSTFTEGSQKRPGILRRLF